MVITKAALCKQLLIISCNPVCNPIFKYNPVIKLLPLIPAPMPGLFDKIVNIAFSILLFLKKPA